MNNCQGKFITVNRPPVTGFSNGNTYLPGYVLQVPIIYDFDSCNCSCQNQGKDQITDLCDSIVSLGDAIGDLIKAGSEYSQKNKIIKQQKQENQEIADLKQKVANQNKQIAELTKLLQGSVEESGKKTPKTPEAPKDDVTTPPQKPDTSKTKDDKEIIPPEDSKTDVSAPSAPSSTVVPVDDTSDKETTKDSSKVKDLVSKCDKILNDVDDFCVSYTEAIQIHHQEDAFYLSISLGDYSKDIATNKKSLTEMLKQSDLSDLDRSRINNTLLKLQDAEKKIADSLATEPLGIEDLKTRAKNLNKTYVKETHNIEDQKAAIAAYNDWARAVLDESVNATKRQVNDCIASLEFITTPGNNSSEDEFVVPLVDDSKALLKELYVLQKQQQTQG